MASRLRRLPVVVGNSGSPGSSGAFVRARLCSTALVDGIERCASFLAALADGVHVRAGGEGDVAAGQAGEFGDPQPGLDGQREHGVVASPGPGALVAGGEQRVDLGSVR